MKIRIGIAAATVVALASFALAGCSASPAPTTKAAASCTPSTAKYFWGKGQRTVDVPLGVHILTYSQGGSMVLDTDKTFNVKPAYTAGLLRSLAAESHTSVSSWQTAILQRARSRPSFGSWFGEQVPLGKNFVTIHKPLDGSYVVDVVENQFELPVVVTCGSNDPVSGTVTGAAAGGMGGFAIRCGVPLTADARKQVGSADALSYCPAS